MPQGRDIGEAGPKSVTLATVGDDGSIRIEERHTSVAQFERIPVDLDKIESWREVVNALGLALGNARNGAASEHFVARVQLTGTTALAWRLRRDLDLLQTEAESLAAGLGRTWIDKVEVGCRAPVRSSGIAASSDAHPLEELRRLMGEVAVDDAYRAEITAIAEQLRVQLPPECRGLLGGDPEAFAANLATASRDGIDDVFARLKAAPESEDG
jgi:DNA repair protein SbcD/Mre11